MRKTIKPRRSSNGEAINLIIEKERTTDYSKPISDINTNLSIKVALLLTSLRWDQKRNQRSRVHLIELVNKVPKNSRSNQHTNHIELKLKNLCCNLIINPYTNAKPQLRQDANPAENLLKGLSPSRLVSSA